MKTQRKSLNRKIIFGICLTFFSCGGGGGKVHGNIQNQAVEFDVSDVTCQAELPLVPYLGEDGVLSQPLTCIVSFQTSGVLGSSLVIQVADAAVAYQNLNRPLFFPGDSLIHMELFIDQQPIPILGGEVIFSEIGNQEGSRVKAEWRIAGANVQLENRFSEKVRLGY